MTFSIRQKVAYSHTNFNKFNASNLTFEVIADDLKKK